MKVKLFSCIFWIFISWLYYNFIFKPLFTQYLQSTHPDAFFPNTFFLILAITSISSTVYLFNRVIVNPKYKIFQYNINMTIFHVFILIAYFIVYY